MATLTIDDETHAAVMREVARSGLELNQWLLEKAWTTLTEDPPPGPEPVRWDEWLEDFVADHAATGRPLDDSRESMYR